MNDSRLFLVGALVGCVIGFVVGALGVGAPAARQETYRSAVKAGVGRYKADAQTGRVEFYWVQPVHLEAFRLIPATEGTKRGD